MPKYQVYFEREYTITEGFTRVIDAPSLAELCAAAENLATGFNSDCPDDCTESGSGGPGAGSFQARTNGYVYEGGEKPDFVIQPDGQIVDYEEPEDAEA